MRESTRLVSEPRSCRDGVRATQDMEAVFWLEDYLAGWSKILFFVSHSQDFMNGVCTHIVRCRRGVPEITTSSDGDVSRRLNEHTKKLDYYTGNYDSYVRERSIRDDEQQRKYDAEQRDIAEIKDFIARLEAASESTQNRI